MSWGAVNAQQVKATIRSVIHTAMTASLDHRQQVLYGKKGSFLLSCGPNDRNGITETNILVV